MENEVWITGAGVISALGCGINEHAAALKAGRSGLKQIKITGTADSDSYFCGIVPETAIPSGIDETAADRADILLEQAVIQALASAGLNCPLNADLIAGTTLGNMHGGTMYYRAMRTGSNPDIRLIKKFLPSECVRQLSRKMNLNGNPLTVCSACASGCSAIGLAFRRIQSGKCTMAIAGGFDALSPFVVTGFNSLKLVSPVPCMPFGENRAGLNPGEGAAMLVIESRHSALERGAVPLAIIAGAGEALEAFHYTRSDPMGSGPESAMRKAIDSAGIKPESIDLVHLHGTGTPANDRSEYSACLKLFGDKLASVSACSTKSATGHTFGASGAINAVFAVISLVHGIIPATLNTVKIDPEFTGLNISRVPRIEQQLSHVAISALGFGGESASLVIKKA